VSTSRKSQLLLAVGGVTIVLLLAAVFTFGSLTLPLQLRTLDQTVLYALSMFIVAALVVFGTVLTRSVVRLWAERRAHQPGSRFKTKMVLGAIAVSFLPVVFLFFVSYALLNRTLVLWFPRPLELATQYSRELIDKMNADDAAQMAEIAKEVVGATADNSARDTIHAFDQAFARGADLAWEVGENGQAIAVAANSSFRVKSPDAGSGANSRLELPTLVSQVPGGVELWQYGGKYFLAGRAKAGNFYFFAGRNVPDDYQNRIRDINAQTAVYGQQRQNLRTYKSQLLLTL